MERLETVAIVNYSADLKRTYPKENNISEVKDKGQTYASLVCVVLYCIKQYEQFIARVCFQKEVHAVLIIASNENLGGRLYEK